MATASISTIGRTVRACRRKFTPDNQVGYFNLRIGSCLACVYRVMDARGKFGEHERSVRVARGAAESNSSFLSALQTSQVHP